MKCEKIVLEISTPIPDNMATKIVNAIQALAEIAIVDDYVKVTRE